LAARATIVLGLAAALVAFAGGSRPAPAWAEGTVQLQGRAALLQAQRAGLDLGSVIETVSHRFEAASSQPGDLVSDDRLYRAEVGADGVSFTLRPKASGAGPAPGLTVRTIALSRGTASVPVVTGRWEGRRNSAFRSLAPTLRERVTARQGRVVWDYVLERVPRTRGPLRIDARVLSRGTAARLGGGRGGWRFAAGAERDVKVSAFRVEDGVGRRVYEALPRLSGRILSVSVPARVLRGAVYPLTLESVVSPEYPPSDPVFGPAPGSQSRESVAFDGANYFVAWTEFRWDAYGDVYGARVTPSGTVLDPGGIAIASGTDQQTGPTVAFGGGVYLVTWMNYRTGATDDVYGARVTTGGTVLDPSGIAISAAAGDQRDPAVASDGTDFLVTWDDTRAGLQDVYGVRVSAGGVVRDSGGFVISSEPNEQLRPAVAFDGADYFVVWADARSGQYRIYGTRVTPAADVLDPGGIAISSSNGGNASVTFGGANYLVVWQSDANDIYGARVTPTGVVLDPAGIAVSTAPGYQIGPVVASDGADYLVAWTDYRAGGNNEDIYGARVSAAGIVLDPAGIPVSTAPYEQWTPAIAFDGTNYLVAFSSQVRAYDVLGARVSPLGSVLDPDGITLSLAATDESTPAVAFDGTNYLVAWGEQRSGTYGIYAARVTQAGDLLDGTGILVAAGALDQSSPRLVYGGTNYLVVWQNTDGGIDGARVSRDGAVLDPGVGAITIASGALDPAVASDGANYLVAWSDARNGLDLDIYATRVSPDGTVLDPGGVPVSTTVGDQSAPTVAFDGTNYLLAWQDLRNGADLDIYGARVSPHGTVLDPAGIPISTAPYDQTAPALAADGGNSLVVWEDDRSGADVDIDGTRVSPDGAVLDPGGMPISTAPNDQAAPTVAFDGIDYLAAWTDWRSGTSPDVYASRISPAGSVLDPAGFAISATSTDETSPGVAGGGPGRVAVAYDRVSPELPYAGATRVFLRFVDSGTADTTPPETTITSGPTGTTASATATFEFTASEPSTFECSLDNHAFALCASPATFAGLADGTHSFRVQATDLAGNTDPTPAEQTWTINTSQAPADFSIAASPASLNVAQGDTGTATINTLVTTGSPQAVTVTANGEPTGTTVTFSPAALTTGDPTTMTVDAGSRTAPGSYTITVTASGTTATHQTTVSLTVTASAFAMSANPTSSSAIQGTTFTSTITTTLLSGAPQPVAMSTAGIPAATTVAFAPSSVAAGGTSSMTLNIGAATPPGTYTITVTGTGTSVTHTVAVTVTVTRNAVVNGGFETGTLTGWTASATGTAPLPLIASPSHSGAYAARLGGTHTFNGNSKLRQTVTVPTGNPQLGFWYQSQCVGPADSIDIQIRSNSGATLAKVVSGCTTHTAWSSVSYGMSAYAGQTVVLWCQAHEQSANPVSLLLDDMTLG
jgi:hypothetical protein